VKERSLLHLFTAEHITRLILQLTCRLLDILKLIYKNAEAIDNVRKFST